LVDYINDLFDVSLCNKENDFIFHYGVNKGVKNAISKVWRCLFISIGAKSVYQNLCLYAYGDKRNCYPSIQRIALDLDCDTKSVIKYLDELIDAGLIQKIKDEFHQKNSYCLIELHEVNILKHSEMVYSFMPSTTREIAEFKKVLKDYKKSELFEMVSKSEYPEKYYHAICSWFSKVEELTNELEELDPVEAGSADNVEDTNETSTNIPSTPNPIQKRLALAKVVPQEYDEVVNIENPKPKRKTRLTYKDKPVNDWSCKDFLQYYNNRYEEMFGCRYGGGRAEEAMIKTLIYSKQNNNHIKKQMDVFLSHSDVFEVLSIQNFVFSKNQALLDSYVRDGKFPAYIRKKRAEPKQNIIEQDTDNLEIIEEGSDESGEDWFDKMFKHNKGV